MRKENREEPKSNERMRQQMAQEQLNQMQQEKYLQIAQQAAEKEKMLQQEFQNKEHDPEHGGIQNIDIIGEKEVKHAMEILQKYKSCKENLEKRIVENEEWFKMQHWKMLRKGKEKESVEPASAWLFNMLLNKHADLMDNYPEALILPREESDEPAADMLSSIIPVILEQNDYEQTYSDCGWYRLKTGTSVQGVFWDNSKLNGLGDVSIRKCDIINLFWESGVTDIQDSANVFYVTVVSNEELRRNYPELKNLGSYPEMDVNKYIYDDKVDTTEKTAVVDWYYKQRIETTDEEGIAHTKTVLQYCKFCNGKVLYASENDPRMRNVGFYEHGMYPFVIDTTFPEEGMLCGFGYIDAFKDNQAYIDKLEQAILDNALINARARSIVNDTAGINVDEFSDPSCTLVHATGNLGENAYRQITAQPLSGIYMSVLNNKIQELKDTSGNTASSQGQASSVTSASGIASLQEAAGKLARDANKSSYRAFRKVIMLVIELIRQFYTEQRCFRITGENGERQFVTFDNSALAPQGQGAAFGVDLGNRLPVFDADIRAAKQSAYSRESQNTMALQFYSAGFFAPTNADAALACLNMMEFEGKDKVTKQVQENQTLLDMVMQLQQQVTQMAALIDMQNGTDLTQKTIGQAQQTMQQQEESRKGTTVNGTAGSHSSGNSLSRQAASAARNATAPR